MLDINEYEEIVCIEGLDKYNPLNYKRKKYLLEFNGEIPKISDSDLWTIFSKLIPADKNLDNYSIGIYTRLQLLSYFRRPLNDIYEYGNSQYVDAALQKLKDNGYIDYNIEEQTFKITNI